MPGVEGREEGKETRGQYQQRKSSFRAESAQMVPTRSSRSSVARHLTKGGRERAGDKRASFSCDAKRRRPRLPNEKSACNCAASLLQPVQPFLLLVAAFLSLHFPSIDKAQPVKRDS